MIERFEAGRDIEVDEAALDMEVHAGEASRAGEGRSVIADASAEETEKVAARCMRMQAAAHSVRVRAAWPQSRKTRVSQTV